VSVDRAKFKADAQACLGQNEPAGALVDCVSRHFDDVEVNRENDDLVIRGGTRFLVVKRDGGDRFRVTGNVAVPSTNTVDAGGGRVVMLDQLIDEISALDD
jgi:hypothetical protein